jgi:hypothetical protein
VASCVVRIGLSSHPGPLARGETIGAVEDLVEDKCAVWCDPDWGVFGAAMPSFAVTRNMIGFVDGRVTDELRRMAEGMGVQTLVGTKDARRTFPGWQVACQRVEHLAVGGITSGVVTLTALTRLPSMLAAAALPFVVARDASTVLSVHPFVSTFRPIPQDIVVDELRCLNLGTVGHPYYHGTGLLPVVLNRQVRVLAPALFAPKGLWGLRHLTCNEILVAKDFSPGMVAKFSGEALSNALLAALSPGKCLVFGFRALINGGIKRGMIKRGIKIKNDKTIVKNDEKELTEEHVDALGITGFDNRPTSIEPETAHDSPMTEIGERGEGEVGLVEGGEGEVGIGEIGDGDFGMKNWKTGHCPVLTRGSSTI